LPEAKRPVEPVVAKAEGPERRDGIGLDAARCQLVLTREELWLDYIGLGGLAGIGQMTAYLDGAGDLTRIEHNTLVQALNEKYLDLEGDHPVPYVD
jgi:hypothetical protein